MKRRSSRPVSPADVMFPTEVGIDLGCSAANVRRMCDAGILDHVRTPNGVRLILRASVLAERARRQRSARNSTMHADAILEPVTAKT